MPRSVPRLSNKRSVLLWQCSDTNRNIKRLVYCRYGKQSLMFLSDERATLEMLDFAFYIGNTPTFLYFDLLPT